MEDFQPLQFMVMTEKRLKQHMYGHKILGIKTYIHKSITYHQKIEDGSVGHQRAKDKKHAGYHPRCDGRHSLRVWRDIGDGVKNVSQHKEERYKECHPTRHNLRWYEKTNPRHYDKKSAGQVVDIQISGNQVSKLKFLSVGRPGTYI